MGAWGEGPFDNDDAADFVAEASDGSADRAITGALMEITNLPAGEYIDVDLGGRAWAAAELVALAHGRGDVAGLADVVTSLVSRLKPREPQRLLALGALPRIADDETSELAQLWHENAEMGAGFDERMADLRSRLEGATDG